MSNADMFRDRGSTLKACFKPLADARRVVATDTRRARDNEFAAPFELLCKLMKEEGVAVPRVKAPPKNRTKKSNGKVANGKAVKVNGKSACAAVAAASPAEPAADLDKDKALLEAFSLPIAQAVKGAA